MPVRFHGQRDLRACTLLVEGRVGVNQLRLDFTATLERILICQRTRM
jgi:hypothetical protein